MIKFPKLTDLIDYKLIFSRSLLCNQSGWCLLPVKLEGVLTDGSTMELLVQIFGVKVCSYFVFDFFCWGAFVALALM